MTGSPTWSPELLASPQPRAQSLVEPTLQSTATILILAPVSEQALLACAVILSGGLTLLLLSSETNSQI